MATTKRSKKRPSKAACKRRAKALPKKRTARAGKALAACRRPAKRRSARNGGPTKASMLRGLDEFTQAYIEAALWSSNDNADESGGEPLDRNYGPEDIETETLAKMIADCKKFQRENAEYIVPGAYKKGSGRYTVSELAGHDFWLTRNGHGAGFWDGDWTKEAGDALDKASEAFGGVDLYVHRGRIYA